LVKLFRSIIPFGKAVNYFGDVVERQRAHPEAVVFNRLLTAASAAELHQHLRDYSA
jgi:hypothetical protein